MLTAVLTENSKTILAERYVDKVHDKTVEGLWDRVSLGNKDYHRLVSNLLFLPNSPTLFNMGLPTGGTSSACFVFDVDDTLLGDWPAGGKHEPFITSILGTNFKAACVAKAGGGVGYYFGKLREEGALVNSTHKRACGPVAVLRYYNFLRALITQGGKRDLAQMGVLDAHHPDIRKFIHVKDEDPQALGSFNISVSWRNRLLDQIQWDRLENYGPEDHTEASDWTRLWWEQCQSAWKSGDPGVLFWDTINAANATPHLGDINATNPCGETPNLNNEPCNLGSLALCRYLIDHGRQAKVRFTFDAAALREDTRVAIRYLDDILDNNNFPHPDITAMALATRKLGLGAMGVADLLAILGIPYDSAGAVDFVTDIAADQARTAFKESVELAHKKGPYPAWGTAPPEVKDKFPWCRNSTRTSIAPTGTIAIIAGVFGSIEPYFAFDAERTTYEGIKMADGIQPWVKAILRETGHVPKVASDVHWKWHIRHQAAWQKHTDLGVSKTINMPNSATVKDISDAYRMMYETGCKGGTIFRDGCRAEQVLVKRETESVYLTTQPATAAPPAARKLPDTRKSVTHKFRVGRVKAYLTVGLFEDGTPAEVFLRVGKQGSAVTGMLDAWAISVSTLLQTGTKVEELVTKFADAVFEPNGLTGNKAIPTASSVPDYVVRWMAAQFGAKPEQGGPETTSAPETHTGHYCPDCSKELRREGSKCLVCSCGYSKC